MRFLFLNLISAIMLIAAFSQISLGQDDGFTETEDQSGFAQSLPGSVSDVIQANWTSAIDLWVYADGVNQATARNIALDVIYLGKNQLDQSFCVHVHNGDFQAIAEYCWSAP
jgi:hypothetical protein